MVKTEPSPIPNGAHPILEHTALLALGGVTTTAAFAGLLTLFAPFSNPWLEGAAGVAFYVGLFFVVLTWIERYSAADWDAPRRIGRFELGAAAQGVDFAQAFARWPSRLCAARSGFATLLRAP